MKTFYFCSLHLFLTILAVDAFAVNPDNVKRLAEEPKNCRFLGFFSDESKKSTPFTGSGSLLEEIAEVLREKVAEKGGDSYFVVSRDDSTNSAKVEAKGYDCTQSENNSSTQTESSSANEKRSEPKSIPYTTIPEKEWRFGATGQLGLVYMGVGGGLGGQLYLNKSFEVGTTLLFAKVDLDDEIDNDGADDHLETIEMSIVELAGFLRWRPAANALPSLGLSGGVGYANGSGEYGYKIERGFLSSASDKSVTDSFETHAFLPQIALSNIWRFDSGFTIGAYWISISAPFVLVSGFNDGEIEEEAASDNVDYKNGLKDEINTIFVPKSFMTIGWVF